MPTYPALIDGAKGAYGVTFPDLPGIVAMGKTIDEAILNAKAALNDYAIETQADGDSLAPPTPPDQVPTTNGQTLVSIPLNFQPQQGAQAH